MFYNRMRVQVIISVLTLLGAHIESSPAAPAKQTLTLEELVPLRPDFFPDRLSVQWISENQYIYNDHDEGIRKYNANNDTYTTVLNPYDLFKLNGYSVNTFSENGNFVLLTLNTQKVYRYSTIAEYAAYDLEHKKIYNISQGPLQTAVWGDKRSLAFVQNNNVYYMKDVTQPNLITVLTNEGVPGAVYFGVPDWIYEEEVFNAAEALWFSPSGTFLAVASFNDTIVESAVFPYYGNPADLNNQYPHLVHFKYPKVGRVNPAVGLRVFKVNDPTSEAWNIPAPVDVVGIDHILGRVNWASDTNLIVLWLNRRQSVSILVNCDLLNDKCSIVRQTTEPDGWIDIEQPVFADNGTNLIQVEPMYLGEHRFMHAARFNLDALTLEDMTPLNYTVTEILGYDEERSTLYYIAAPVETPWQRQMWSSTVGEIQSVDQCVSCKEPSCHYVVADFAPSAKHGIVTCSATNDPPKIYHFTSKGDKFKLMEDNSRLRQKLNRYNLPMPLFNKISIGDDLTANIKLLLPPNMQKEQKYPMVVRVYAGPGTARVKDNFDLEYYSLYLAGNRSYIVGSIDVRGSGVMGVEALHAVNNALGTVEVNDTLAAIRQLLNLYPFIDAYRVGVWGWSYGGYATTMMLIQDEQKTVACGAAVAPVTSWLYYDSIYTERYMDTPAQNPDGYIRSDLMAHAEKLRGRKLLLVHGTGDDNVHYQHSLQLAKQLQRADISFEQMSYTDETHSLLGVSRHFYHTLDHFWTECFR